MKNRANSGQSLIQVVVSLGIASVLMGIVISSLSMMSRENRALSEKLAANDLSRSISQFLDSAKCNQLFDPARLVAGNSFTYDPANITYPYRIALTSLPGDLATLGDSPSSFANSLQVKAGDGIYLELPNQTDLPLLKVEFDQTSLVRPIAALSFKINLSSTTSGANVTLTGCLGVGGGNVGIRFEGENNVAGSTCPSTYVGGFCDSSFVKHITFATPFTIPPKVIVSGRVDSIFTYCPCCTGAFDQIIAVPQNITTTGFDVITAISPFMTSCGTPYSNWVTQMAFDWLAVGE